MPVPGVHLAVLTDSLPPRKASPVVCTARAATLTNRRHVLVRPLRDVRICCAVTTRGTRRPSA